MSSNEYMMGLGEEMREYLEVIRESFSSTEDYIRCCEMALEVMEADLTPEQEYSLIAENAGYYGIELDDSDEFDFSEMFDEPNDSDSDDTEVFDFDEMFASICSLTESLS